MKEMRANVVAECTLKESAAINQILGRRVGHSVAVLGLILPSALMYLRWLGEITKRWRFRPRPFPGPISSESTKVPLSINIQSFMNQSWLLSYYCPGQLFPSQQHRYKLPIQLTFNQIGFNKICLDNGTVGNDKICSFWGLGKRVEPQSHVKSLNE